MIKADIPIVKCRDCFRGTSSARSGKIKCAAYGIELDDSEIYCIYYTPKKEASE